METFCGAVVYWNAERWFGLIRLYNDFTVSRHSSRGNETFFVRGSNIVPDEYGSRHLVRGECVEFVEDTEAIPIKNRPDLAAKRFAKDVKATERAPRPADYTEDCVVSVIKTRWNTEPVCGFAKRPDGDSLFWHKNDITTDGEIHIGTKFNCVPERNREGSACWRASQIEIYVPEEVNNA